MQHALTCNELLVANSPVMRSYLKSKLPGQPSNSRVERSQLTFGLEIEAICFLLQEVGTHPSPAAADDMQYGIAQALKKGGLSANVFSSDRTYAKHPDYSKWTVTWDNSIKYEPAETARKIFPALAPLNEKRIRLASTITTNVDNLELSHNAVEVISPVLRLEESAHWSKQIGAMLAVMKKFHPAFNDTTGLHIHVGRGRKSFALSQCKKIAAFLVLFETTIDYMHPKTRCKSTPDSYIRSTRWNNNFKNIDDRGAFDKIMSVTSIKDLQNIVNYASPETDMHYHRYSFMSLGEIGTIEFRQHEATIDGDAISNWIILTAAIVEYASNCDKDVLKQQLTGNNLTLELLFKMLGYPTVPDYYRRMHTRSNETKA